MEALTQNTSGESNTEPTAAILARRRNTSPILRMISTGGKNEVDCKGYEVDGRDKQTFVWETDFTGLTDNLGILFRLHYRSRNQLFELLKDDIKCQRKGENDLQGRRKSLTRDIFTDCESAWDNDNFVLEINLSALEISR